jgi:hypothetical protein
MGFEQLLRCSCDTDDIFNQAFPILIGLLHRISNEIDYYVICAIGTLARWSRLSVEGAFDVVISVMLQVLNSTDPSMAVLLANCVECVANLSLSVPEKFSTCAADFAAHLLHLLTIGDPQLSGACLDCYGKVMEHCHDQIKGTIERFMDMAFELSGCDQTSNLVSRKIQEELEGVDPDADEFVVKDSLELAGGALMVMSSVIERYPELLEPWILRITERLRLLSDSVVDYSQFAVTKSIGFLTTAFVSCPFDFTEILQSFCLILQKIIESAQDIGLMNHGLTAIAHIVNTFGVERIGEFLPGFVALLESGLEGSLLCFGGSESLPEEAYESFSVSLDAVFRNAPELVPPKTLDKILEMTRTTNVSQKKFGLGVLRSLLEVQDPKDMAFCETLLLLSLEIADTESGSQGFYTIKRMVTLCPDLVRAHLQQIMFLIDKGLNSGKSKRKSRMQAMDNCISCFGQIVMHIIGDEFAIMNYAKRVLELIPAGVDEDENADLLDFVMWMLNKEGFLASFGRDVLGVFVRLFGRSENELRECGIEEGVLGTLRLVFGKVAGLVSGGNEYCLALCKGHGTKIGYVRTALGI